MKVVLAALCLAGAALAQTPGPAPLKKSELVIAQPEPTPAAAQLGAVDAGTSPAAAQTGARKKPTAAQVSNPKTK